MILEHIEGLPLGVALCLCHFPPAPRSERRSMERKAVELILSELLGESVPRRGYDPLGRPILLDHPAPIPQRQSYRGACSGTSYSFG